MNKFMRKNVTRIRIIIIGIFSLLTIGIWVAAEIYHQFLQDTISSDYEAQINPLNPRLPIEVLDQLESKNSLPVDLNQTGNIILPTSTPPPSDETDLVFTAPVEPESDSVVDGTSDTIPL